MTQDVVVVTDIYQESFARQVYQAVNQFEKRGFTVEIKFSTSEGRQDGSTTYSALLHAYEAE